MKYTYIKDASIINIPVLLTIIVGEENPKNVENPVPTNNPINVLSPKMLLLIFFLFSIVALLFWAIWYYKRRASRNSQIIQYEEKKPEEFEIFHAPNGNLIKHYALNNTLNLTYFKKKMLYHILNTTHY